MHSEDRACATLCHPRLQHACDIPSPPSSCAWRLGPTIPKYVSGTIALSTFVVAGVRHGPGRAVVAPLNCRPCFTF